MAAGLVVLGQEQATMVPAVGVPPILLPQVVFFHPSLPIPIPYFSLLVAVAAAGTAAMAEHLRMSLVVVAAAISAAVLLMLKPLQAMPLCRIRMAVP